MCPTLCTDFSDSFTSEKFVLMIGRFATIRNCSSLCVVVEHASRNTMRNSVMRYKMLHVNGT